MGEGKFFTFLSVFLCVVFGILFSLAIHANSDFLLTLYVLFTFCHCVDGDDDEGGCFR